mgnify:CR=1 FL=1
MRRPRFHDVAIIEASAAEWTAIAARRYPDIAGVEGFATTLAKAAAFTATLDPAELAGKLARMTYSTVDQELLDAMDEYLGHHAKVHAATVEKWLSAWGPARPFDDYARVEAAGFDGVEEGLGMMEACYARTGQFLFLPDSWKQEAVEPSGNVRRWQVIAWEDVRRCQPPSDEDEAVVRAHRAAVKRCAAESAAAMRDLKARRELERLVEGQRLADGEAEEVYGKLAGSPDEAARVIAALRQAAAAEIAARTAGEQIHLRPGGMLP